MNDDSRRQPCLSKRCNKDLFHLLPFLSLLLLMLSCVCIGPSAQSGSSASQPQHIERPENSSLYASMPAYFLTATISRSPNASYLVFTNYQEDTAIREAILANTVQWDVDPQTGQRQYQASNKLSVYVPSTDTSSLFTGSKKKSIPQPDRTLLTARLLLGLWVSRHNDPHLSVNGNVFIHPDEILAWRDIQKHQRVAYPGSQKRFSDGYPWKQKQQVHQDLALLSSYHLRGQQSIRIQGKVHSFPLDAPYISLTPIEKQGKIVSYLVAPGNWISTYEAHHTSFLASVNRQIFQLNPRNDYLAIRLAFYLVEYWRQHAQTEDYYQPFLMSHLLSASMIPLDKANLTSRFVPRVEAALQKLYTATILGEPPINLSTVDTTKAYWGNDWLSSSWRLVPPQEIIKSYRRKKESPPRTVEIPTSDG
jgi:hypothetical protein